MIEIKITLKEDGMLDVDTNQEISLITALGLLEAAKNLLLNQGIASGETVDEEIHE